MNLNKTIKLCRKLGAGPDQIYAILALIEVNALDTPIFAGVKPEDTIRQLYHLLNFLEAEYTNNVNQCLDNHVDFFQYVSFARELSFDLSKFSKVYREMKKQGEEEYEFTKFDRMGE